MKLKINLSKLPIEELDEDIELIYDICSDMKEINILEAESELFEQVDEILSLARKLRDLNIKLSTNSKLNLCLVGKTSSGKSTMINSLLGENLLPTNITDTSRITVKFAFKLIEYIEISSPARQLQKKEFLDLADYTSKPHKEKSSTLINYYYPAEILNLVNIYDTPGLGSCFDHEGSISKYLETADIVFFLRDCELGGNLTNDEIDFINRSPQIKGSLWYLILTKSANYGEIDMVSDTIKEQNKTVLSDRFSDVISHDNISYISEQEWIRFKDKFRETILLQYDVKIDMNQYVEDGDLIFNDDRFNNLSPFFKYQLSSKEVRKILRDAASKHYYQQMNNLAEMDQIYREKRYYIFCSLLKKLEKYYDTTKRELSKSINPIQNTNFSLLNDITSNRQSILLEYEKILNKSLKVDFANGNLFDYSACLRFTNGSPEHDSAKIVSNLSPINGSSIQKDLARKYGTILVRYSKFKKEFKSQGDAKEEKKRLIKRIMDEIIFYYDNSIINMFCVDKDIMDKRHSDNYLFIRLSILISKIKGHLDQEKSIELSISTDIPDAKIEILSGETPLVKDKIQDTFKYQFKSINGSECITIFINDEKMNLTLPHRKITKKKNDTIFI